MCVSGECMQTADGSTGTNTGDGGISGKVETDTSNDTNETGSDADSSTDSETDTDTGAVLIYLDSDTVIDAETILGCYEEYAEYGTCSNDEEYSFEILSALCDELYIGGCPIVEDCVGKCEFIITDTDDTDLKTYTLLYYTLGEINVSSLQTLCTATGNLWAVCE